MTLKNKLIAAAETDQNKIKTARSFTDTKLEKAGAGRQQPAERLQGEIRVVQSFCSLGGVVWLFTLPSPPLPLQKRKTNLK